MALETILIDDERNNIQALEALIGMYCPELTVTHTFEDPRAAKRHLSDHSTDLVFTDIQMPFMSGFDLLEALPERNFQVVFVSAYDHFAIKAIRINALDFLLKPVDPDELQHAARRAAEKLLFVQQEQVSSLQRFRVTRSLETIALPSTSGLSFIKAADIVLLEAQGAYTSVVTAKGKYLVSKNLASFEEILCDGSAESNGFFRAHKSFLINLRCVQEYIKGEGGEIVMQGGATVALSRTKKQEFLELFQKV